MLWMEKYYRNKNKIHLEYNHDTMKPFHVCFSSIFRFYNVKYQFFLIRNSLTKYFILSCIWSREVIFQNRRLISNVQFNRLINASEIKVKSNYHISKYCTKAFIIMKGLAFILYLNTRRPHMRRILDTNEFLIFSLNEIKI